MKVTLKKQRQLAAFNESKSVRSNVAIISIQFLMDNILELLLKATQVRCSHHIFRNTIPHCYASNRKRSLSYIQGDVRHINFKSMTTSSASRGTTKLFWFCSANTIEYFRIMNKVCSKEPSLNRVKLQLPQPFGISQFLHVVSGSCRHPLYSLEFINILRHYVYKRIRHPAIAVMLSREFIDTHTTPRLSTDSLPVKNAPDTPAETHKTTATLLSRQMAIAISESSANNLYCGFNPEAIWLI